MLRNFIKTDMVKRYSFKLFIRVAIFLFVFALYIINKTLIGEILTMEFSFGIMDGADLFMLTVFYFLCDYICILFFCPFQNFVMKNKCCVNCRIYDWGHFMMFTPMLFIKNFYCWSLFFTALVVLIRWEIVYAMYPERFWSGSNQTLQCASCKDKTCQWKKSGSTAKKKRKG